MLAHPLHLPVSPARQHSDSVQPQQQQQRRAQSTRQSHKLQRLHHRLQTAAPAELLANVRKQKEESKERDVREFPTGPDGDGGAGVSVSLDEECSRESLGNAMEIEPPAQQQWPFWRRKRVSASREARLLTRRVVELGRRKRLDQVRPW